MQQPHFSSTASYMKRVFAALFAVTFAVQSACAEGVFAAPPVNRVPTAADALREQALQQAARYSGHILYKTESLFIGTNPHPWLRLAFHGSLRLGLAILLNSLGHQDAGLAVAAILPIPRGNGGTQMPPEEAALIEAATQLSEKDQGIEYLWGSPLETARRRLAVLGALRQVKARLGDVISDGVIVAPDAATGYPKGAPLEICFSYRQGIHRDIQNRAEAIVRPVLMSVGIESRFVSAKGRRGDSIISGLNVLRDWLTFEPNNELVQDYLAKWDGQTSVHGKIDMHPGSGSTQHVTSGQWITLEAQTSIPEAKVQLWSNRSGIWGAGPRGREDVAAPIDGRPGWYSISVPADRNFEYTFRVWDPDLGTWEFAPLPHGNARIVIVGVREARFRSPYLLPLWQALTAGRTTRASATAETLRQKGFLAEPININGWQEKIKGLAPEQVEAFKATSLQRIADSVEALSKSQEAGRMAFKLAATIVEHAQYGYILARWDDGEFELYALGVNPNDPMLSSRSNLQGIEQVQELFKEVSISSLEERGFFVDARGLKEASPQASEMIPASHAVIRPFAKPSSGRRPRVVVIGAMESAFIKKGGEADYVKDLSDNLRGQDEVYVVTPHFRRSSIPGKVEGIVEQGPHRFHQTILPGTIVGELEIPLGEGSIRLKVRRLKVADRLTYFLLEDPDEVFFQDVYQDADHIRGFVESVLLSHATVLVPKLLGVQVDTVHVNDYQTALTAVFLKTFYRADFPDAAAIYICHNMQYQGQYEYLLPIDPVDRDRRVLQELYRQRVLPPPSHTKKSAGPERIDLGKLLKLPPHIVYGVEGGLNHWGKLTLAKGMAFTDKFVAVSKGSLRSLLLPQHEGGTAFGQDGLLRKMYDEGRVTAIHNGADADPHEDAFLRTSGFRPFSKNDVNVVEVRKANQHALFEALRRMSTAKAGKVHVYGKIEMPAPNDLLIGSVGRLTSQKGIDVLERSLSRIMSLQGDHGEVLRLVILGSAESGDAEGQYLEREFARLSETTYRGRLIFAKGFDAQLASWIYGSEDVFVMPSLQEPGGIANQIAQVYGAPVIAPLTGGLVDFFEEWGAAGFPFRSFMEHQKSEASDWLFEATRLAADTYWRQPEAWNRLVQQALHYDSSWKSRIAFYRRDVYESAIQLVRGTRTEDSVPGAAGFWTQTGLGVRGAAIAESLWAAAGMLMAGARASEAFNGDWKAIVLAVAASGLVFLVAMQAAHFVTGVLLRNGATVRRDWNTSLHATGTASWSLLAAPFIVAGLLQGGATGFLLTITGVALGLGMHLARNLGLSHRSIRTAEFKQAA